MGDEQDLVNEILDGNAEAFEHLVNRYKALVVHVVYRMIQSTEDREDVCQDVFMKIYRGLAGFRFQSKLSTWIARVAYNTSANHLGKKREALADEYLPEIESLDHLPGYAQQPDEVAEERDISRRLQAEIEILPTVYRTILTLYHIGEMTYDEIGRTMGLPEGTVKSYLFRARKHLKARLMSKYRREDLWP